MQRSKALLATVMVVCVLATGAAAPAAPAASPATGPQLGSPGFQPTPDRPVGWRGDWTGRFPGATPPPSWSRRVKGVTSDLRYQARKPSGDPGPGSAAMEYFTVKDWLVAGPLAVDDAEKDIGRDLLGGEAAVEPDAGDKAAGVAWQPLHVNTDTQSRHDHNEGTCGQSYVDFIYLYGKITSAVVEKIEIEGDFNNKAAYAHTYIHSPAEAKVRLRMPFAGTAARFWLNGKPTDLDPKNRDKLYDVTLVKGWNRLLLKVTAAKGLGKHYSGRWLSDWMIACYVEPVPPVSYETRGVAWMTKMTGRSASQPIVVGDRIFVGSGISDLLCLAKKDGKVLWLRPNTPYDALSAEEKGGDAVKEKIEPLATKLNRLNDEAVAAINAAVSPQGLPSAEAAELDKKLKERTELERSLHKELFALDRKRFRPLYDNEVSSTNGTPVSDGRHVYMACGGGSKGPGANVVACFDLDGNRTWTYHEAFGAQEHGTHTSPFLQDGRLVFAAFDTLVAFDAATGKVLWKNKRDENHFGDVGSPVPVRIGGAAAIVGGKFLYRGTDGVPFAKSLIDPWGVLTPVVEGGLLLNPSQWKGWSAPLTFAAVRLPGDTADGAKAEVVWQPDGKDVAMPIRGLDFYIASPLCVDGIVYAVNPGGGLTAVDVGAKKCLYHQWLDGYARYNRMVYGVAASPTLGGKAIYIIDDAGTMHVLKPGPAFKELTHHILENIHVSGQGGNPCRQESFYTSPYFEGKSIYLRGEEYLYCIRQE